MKIGIPKETASGETRVSAIPETVGRYVKSGLAVVVQAGAGAGSFYSDREYEEAGATICPDAGKVFSESDVIVKTAPPSEGEMGLLRSGQVLVAPLAPLTEHARVRALAAAGVASLSLDTIPRITRAQSMDILSSMSTIAGYKAVLLAANAMGKICPMMMTAAGTLKPANALVIGAGVAGLQAIATAKRLGAVVTGVDVRPAAKEQVESLGARFLPMEVDHGAEGAGGYAADLGEAFYQGEQEILRPAVQHSDMIISTAMIPGRAAPILITEAMVDEMRPGSAIVDLAAIAGGNCSLTKPDEAVLHNGVRILGPTNLAAEAPAHASMMFSRNVATFLKELIDKEGKLSFDMENEVVSGTLITREGRVVHAATLKAMGEGPGGA